MRTPIVFSFTYVAIILGLSSAAVAQTYPGLAYPVQTEPREQLSALPPGTGLSPSSNSTNPGEQGLGPDSKPGNTAGTPPHPHYPAPMTYDPYTHNLGPCPEGGQGSGCDRPQGKVIQPPSPG